jgi:hypothetical protein
MKSTKAPVSKALLDVWEAKKRVYEDTKGMTPQERMAYFKTCSEDLARALGKRWVRNDNGSYSLK